MSIPIRQLDRKPLLAADRVAELRRQTGSNKRSLILGVLRQEPHESSGEDIRPDRARNRRADGSAKGARDVQQRHRGGGVLVIDGGEDGELADENEDGAADGDEDLAHDDVADVAVGLAEVDHQAESKSIQRDGDVKQPPVEARTTDREADDEQQEARDDGEGVVDVAGLGDGDVEDDLQEGLEVQVPGVVGDLVDHVERAGADHGAVGEEVEGHPRRGRPVVFVHAEEDHHGEADDDHRDDPAGGPAVGGGGGEVEGEEEDHETAGEEEDTDDWEKSRC